jgi:hypothetical protein
MNSMTVQSAIRTHVSQEGPCTLESLLNRLSQFSWSEIFSVVDQLSREGRLILRRPATFEYKVPMPAASASLPPGPSWACDSAARLDDCAAS